MKPQQILEQIQKMYPEKRLNITGGNIVEYWETNFGGKIQTLANVLCTVEFAADMLKKNDENYALLIV